ncbi:MAG: hypothetical protein ABI369_02810 [Acetobacteraceae bacterium]
MREAGWLVGMALAVGSMQASLAQQAQTLNGPPVQIQPYVGEPGVPNVTITLGTPNPLGGLTGGTGGTGGGGLGSGGSPSGGSSDALNIMIGTPWGAQVAANAQALGVNASALAATCVLESGCGADLGGGGGAQGVFQMYPAAFSGGLNTALAANPALASQIVRGAAGMNDPVTEGIAASGYLMQANQALQNAGVSSPTVVDARGYYNMGPAYGAQLALDNQDEPIANVLSGMSAPALAVNGIRPGETVGQWRASVASKIGNAANQSVLM